MITHAPTWDSVTRDLLKTSSGTKTLLFKPAKLSEKWVECFYGKNGVPQLEVKKTCLKRAKLLLGWFTIDEKIERLVSGFTVFSSKDTLFRTSKKGVFALSNVTAITGLICNSLLTIHFSPLSFLTPLGVDICKKVLTIGLSIFSLKSLFDIQALVEKRSAYLATDPGLPLQNIKLTSKCVCLLEAGFILGVLVTSQVTIVPLLSTMACILSISKNYYERLYL